MLARITDNAGELTGVNRTFLDIERHCVADIVEPKRVIGNLHGNAVRFGTPGPVLAVGEGIESVLSIGSAFPRLPLAACLTSTHLSLFDVPETVSELWIIKDNDEAGETAARLLNERAQANKALIIHELDPVLGDFNDDIRQWSVQSLRDRFIGQIGESAARFVLAA
nr:toprim domain-containing protein [Notoacmeibacter sp. MSK16QG-6]